MERGRRPLDSQYSWPVDSPGAENHYSSCGRQITLVPEAAYGVIAHQGLKGGSLNLGAPHLHIWLCLHILLCLKGAQASKTQTLIMLVSLVFVMTVPASQ